MEPTALSTAKSHVICLTTLGSALDPYEPLCFCKLPCVTKLQLIDHRINIIKLELNIYSTRRGISTYRLDPVHDYSIAFTESGHSVRRKSTQIESVPILKLSIVVLRSELIDDFFHVWTTVSTGGGATLPSIPTRASLDVFQEIHRDSSTRLHVTNDSRERVTIKRDLRISGGPDFFQNQPDLLSSSLGMQSLSLGPNPL